MSRGSKDASTVVVGWRATVSDEELVGLTRRHGGRERPGWWDRVRPHSLGWVVARDHGGTLVGFVNVAWDGGAHAFLLDTKVAPERQRQGVATRVVRLATEQARGAGCEWLHVDFEERLQEFYLQACGFRPTAAGLIRLRV